MNSVWSTSIIEDPTVIHKGFGTVRDPDANTRIIRPFPSTILRDPIPFQRDAGAIPRRAQTTPLIIIDTASA